MFWASLREWVAQSRSARGLLRQQLSSPQAEVRSDATVRIFFGVTQWAVISAILYLFRAVLGGSSWPWLQPSLTILSIFSLVVCMWWLFQYQSPAVLAADDWTAMLTSRPWLLYFNPPSRSKPISFLQGGAIGEGRNKNEHSWRVSGDKLELVQEDGLVHSRFAYNARSGSFIHTNDADTNSIKGQYIVATGS